MNKLRDQFLTSATRSRDEHRCVGRCDAAREVDRPAKHRRDTENLHAVAIPVFSSEFRLLLLRLTGDAYGVDSASDQDLEMGRGERLRQVVPGAEAKRFDARGDAGIAGHHDDDSFGAGLERGAQEFLTGDVAHVQIKQHYVEPAMPEQFQRLLPTRGRCYLVAVAL